MEVEYGIIRLDYYYWNDRLIYAGEKEFNFPMLSGNFFKFDRSGKPRLVFEKKCYFNEGRLILGKMSGKRRYPKLRPNEDPSELLAPGEFYLLKQHLWHLEDEKK